MGRVLWEEAKCLYPLGFSRELEITRYTSDLYLKETVYTFRKLTVCIRRDLYFLVGSHPDVQSLLFIDEQSDTISLLFTKQCWHDQRVTTLLVKGEFLKNISWHCEGTP